MILPLIQVYINDTYVSVCVSSERAQFALLVPPSREHLQDGLRSKGEGRRGRKEKHWFLFMSRCLSVLEDGFISPISLFYIS